jgi:hypothetical protein
MGPLSRPPFRSEGCSIRDFGCQLIRVERCPHPGGSAAAQRSDPPTEPRAGFNEDDGHEQQDGGSHPRADHEPQIADANHLTLLSMGTGGPPLPKARSGCSMPNAIPEENSVDPPDGKGFRIPVTFSPSVVAATWLRAGHLTQRLRVLRMARDALPRSRTAPDPVNPEIPTPSSPGAEVLPRSRRIPPLDSVEQIQPPPRPVHVHRRPAGEPAPGPAGERSLPSTPGSFVCGTDR